MASTRTCWGKSVQLIGKKMLYNVIQHLKLTRFRHWTPSSGYIINLLLTFFFRESKNKKKEFQRAPKSGRALAWDWSRWRGDPQCCPTAKGLSEEIPREIQVSQPRDGSGQDVVQPGTTSANHLANDRKTIGKLWFYGKTIGKPWENCGLMGKP